MKKVIIACFVFQALNSFCQNNIEGVIFDENKNKLEGVSIYLPTIHKGTTSDKDGKFIIKEIPNKNVKVQFSMLGHETLVANLSEDFSEIILKKTIIEIEEIVVSGGFINTTDRSAIKIESISLENLSFHAAPSLTLALADEPSIEMIKLGNSITKPVIRGLSGNRVVVLYQGVKTSNQAWGSEHGVFIPEEGIESVEVIKGPASLLFGSEAMGGALNFIPLKPLAEKGRKSKFSTSIYSASLGLQSSFVSQKKKENWFHTYGLGYQNHADYKLPNNQFADNSRYVQHYAFGNWGITQNWGILKGVYSSSYTNTGLVKGISHESERKIENPWQQVGDHFVTAEGLFWLNDWTIKPSFSYQLNHRKEFENEHEDDHKGENEPALDMSLRTNQYDVKLLKSNTTYELIFGSQGMHQTNTNEGEEELIPNATTNDFSLYTLVNKKLNALQLQSGLRADFRQLQFLGKTKEFKDYTLSFGGTYHLNKYVFRSNIAQGFRAPNLYELSADGEHHGANRYEIGDENLVSEKNLEVDFSFHIHTENYVFDLALFHNYIEDYIYISPTSDTSDGGLTIYQTYQDPARLYGGEAGIDLHPPLLHDLHLKSTFSLIYADNLHLNEPLSMIPSHKWNTEIEYVFDNLSFADKLRVSLNYNYYFAQNRISSLEEISNNYSLINVNCGIHKGNHQLSLHAHNLLNTEYIPHLSLLKESGVYEQGRSFSLKYSISF